MSTSGTAQRLERNQLLRALPRADYQRLLPDLRHASLARGTVLFEPHQRLTHVYFPQHCVISLLTPVGTERGVEVAIAGNEGMVGLDVFLGAESATTRAVCQVPNDVRELPVRVFRRAAADGTAFRALLLRYTNALLGQVEQFAACNQRHRVAQRCARWFLMIQDRVGADRFVLTQEFLSQMLDVERPTVSAAAQRLQAAHAIQYRRGQVTVTDRALLERASCSCYRVIAENYARAFA